VDRQRRVDLVFDSNSELPGLILIPPTTSKPAFRLGRQFFS
jgi:hypothetical protein